MKGDKITRMKLSDQVYDKLWNMIASEELNPGDRLPSERVLMERFGVGRPAIREALQSLENKGVITITHGEGSRVKSPDASSALDQIDKIALLLLSSDPHNIEHLKNARKVLEYGTIQFTCANCSAEDVADLRSLIEKQKSHIGNTPKFIEKDIEFHVRIAEISGNPILKSVTKAMLSWLFEYYQPLLYWAGQEETTIKEHIKIVDSLEAQNEKKAVSAMQEHLNRQKFIES